MKPFLKIAASVYLSSVSMMVFAENSPVFSIVPQGTLPPPFLLEELQ